MIPHSKPFIGESERKYVEEVMCSDRLVGGEYSLKFSAELKKNLSANQVYHTSSGSEALLLLLKALDLPPKSEIILSTYVCESVFYAVLNAGLIPVLCDIGDNWDMTAEKVKEKITSNTGAIIMVYIFGLKGDIKSILSLGYPVIEDICQSFGLRIDDQMAGTFGIASFCSFGPIKCITTGGVGGCAFTSNEKLAYKINDFYERYIFTSPLTELNAAFGFAQLETYDTFLERRIKIAEKYNSVLSNLLSVVKTSFGKGINYRFVTKIESNPTDIINLFANHGISLRRGVDQLLHRKFNIKGDFENSEITFNSTVSWPIYPALNQMDLDYILTFAKKIL